MRKLIEIAGLSNIGTDFVNDTNPVKKMPLLRDTVYILDTIVGQLGEIYDTTNTLLPRQNIIKVVDDGNKGQLIFELLNDVETTVPIHTFTYDTNIVQF